MPDHFIISDTHFGHANILRFTKSDGSLLREFSCVEEMDQHMVDRWNAVVRPTDRVYHLGDVAMKQQDLATIGRCNGHKRLILGNHDKFKTQRYLQFFEQVYGTRSLDVVLLSHVPVHPASVGKAIANVHGHVHNNVPPEFFGPRYFNVSVEVIDYTPIAYEDLKLRIKAQQ